MKRTNTAVWMEKYGRWQIKVQKDGVRKTFSSSTPGRAGQREANAKADAWLDEGIHSTTTRVSDLYREYSQEMKDTTSFANWRKIESAGNAWILPQIGQMKISNVTENHLQQILIAMHKAGRSKKTIMGTRGIISQFFKFCRRLKVTALNPEFLEIPKGAYTKGKTILQPDHLTTLFSVETTAYRGKAVKDPLIYAYRFQVLTGLRPGELLGLRWEDIIGSQVNVRRSLNIHNQITAGKNENAIRSFCLTETARKVLEDQRREHPAFVGPIFKVSSERLYYQRWGAYCRANGIPHVTPYELRHTFVSVAKNLPEGKIRALVGHSRNMDTLGTYAHEMQMDMERTANDLERVFQDVLTSNL